MNKMSIILLSCAVLISTSTIAWIINSNHLFPYDIMNVPLVPSHYDTITSIDDNNQCGGDGKSQSPIAIISIPCTTYEKYIFTVCDLRIISEDDITLIM